MLSGVTSLATGLVVALLRLYGPRWLRPVIVFYIDSMRAIPVLVVLVWTFFALPIVAGITMPPFYRRAARPDRAPRGVCRGDRACRASSRCGPDRRARRSRSACRRRRSLRRIILPQAIVRMLPAFGSLLSITIKDTAIASVIAVTEFMRQSETVAGQSFQPIEVYTFAMLVYFVILFPVTRGVERVYRRVAHLGRS